VLVWGNAGVPYCLGAGGLAGQYWFGGRSRVSDFPGVREVGSWIGVWEFVCEDF